jgi:negative regulator of flagellin synthesis FlgM
MDNRKLSQQAREPEIRVELVARVRREIAEGRYDTPEKLEIALERLLERMNTSE